MALAFPKPTAVRDRVAYKREREAALQTAQRVVWQRDEWHCRCCLVRVVKSSGAGIRGHVHHLVSRSRSRADRANVRNLVLLCAVCHTDAHAYRLVIHGANANGSLKFERTA